MAKARPLQGPGGMDFPLDLDAPVNLTSSSAAPCRPAVQSRIGEELRIVSPLEEFRAIYSSDFFWEVADGS